jgi:exosome complex component RRP42
MEIESSIETLRSLDPRGVLRSFTAKNTRPSGRQHAAARATTIVPSVVPRNTYGSSLVRLGDTQILTAVTLLVGIPGPATPDEGDCVVSLTVSPVCGRGYNLSGRIIEGDGGGGSTAGASSTDNGGSVSKADPSSIESHLQRVVRTSGFIDFSALGIITGKAAWRLKIGCVVLNDAGNLFDAGLLGCMSALNDTRLPRTRINDKASPGDGGMVQIVAGEEIDNCGSGGSKLRLNMGKMPIPLTVAMFDDKLLVDPDDDEEGVLDGTLTVVVNMTGGIVSMDKRGRTIMSAEQLAACVHMAHGRAKELGDILGCEA